MGLNILVIFPTVISTRLALFNDDREIRRSEIMLDPHDISGTLGSEAQFAIRLASAEDTVNEWFKETEPPHAMIGAAFPRFNLPPGLYQIDGCFQKHLDGDYATGRIINQSVMLAFRLAKRFSVSAYALVCISNMELDTIYKISGMPHIAFNGLTRMVLLRRAIRNAAVQLGIAYEKLSVVATFLGKGFSVCAQSEGRIRDYSDSFERGPFSLKHTGGIPATSIIRMVYSGMWSKVDLLKSVYSSGGMSSYFPGENFKEIINSVKNGDRYASVILEAMLHQLASEISAQTCALYGRVDAFVLTGQCTENDFFISMLKEKISWICEKFVIQHAEDELQILAFEALKILRGETTAILQAHDIDDNQSSK